MSFGQLLEMQFLAAGATIAPIRLLFDIHCLLYAVARVFVLCYPVGLGRSFERFEGSKVK